MSCWDLFHGSPMPVLTYSRSTGVQRSWSSRLSTPLFSLKHNLQPQMRWLLKFRLRSSGPRPLTEVKRA